MHHRQDLNVHQCPVLQPRVFSVDQGEIWIAPTHLRRAGGSVTKAARNVSGVLHTSLSRWGRSKLAALSLRREGACKPESLLAQSSVGH